MYSKEQWRSNTRWWAEVTSLPEQNGGLLLVQRVCKVEAPAAGLRYSLYLAAGPNIPVSSFSGGQGLTLVAGTGHLTSTYTESSSHVHARGAHSQGFPDLSSPQQLPGTHLVSSSQFHRGLKKKNPHPGKALERDLTRSGRLHWLHAEHTQRSVLTRQISTHLGFFVHIIPLFSPYMFLPNLSKSFPFLFSSIVSAAQSQNDLALDFIVNPILLGADVPWYKRGSRDDSWWCHTGTRGKRFSWDSPEKSDGMPLPLSPQFGLLPVFVGCCATLLCGNDPLMGWWFLWWAWEQPKQGFIGDPQLFLVSLCSFVHRSFHHII